MKRGAVQKGGGLTPGRGRGDAGVAHGVALRPQMWSNNSTNCPPPNSSLCPTPMSHQRWPFGSPTAPFPPTVPLGSHSHPLACFLFFSPFFFSPYFLPPPPPLFFLIFCSFPPPFFPFPFFLFPVFHPPPPPLFFFSLRSSIFKSRRGWKEGCV